MASRDRALRLQCILWTAAVSVLLLRHLVLQKALWTEPLLTPRKESSSARSISAFQNTQFQLADMATKVEAAKMLVYKAAMKKARISNQSEGKLLRRKQPWQSYMLQKLLWKLLPRLFSLHGGYGYTREYDVERMMRDAKITEIYEGTI